MARLSTGFIYENSPWIKSHVPLPWPRQCWPIMQRLAWAGKHIDAAHMLSNNQIQEDRYAFTAKQEGKGRVVVRCSRVDQYPREFSLLVGDAAHNIRSALDNLAFAIVKPPAGKEKDVYFPIAKTRAKFLEESRRKLPGVSVRVRAAFERLQPYHRRKMPNAMNLARLNILNNWDKHRALAICAVVSGGVSFGTPRINGPHTIESVRLRRGILKEGAIFAVLHVSKTPGQSDMKMYPEIALAPVFDVGMPKELRLLPVLGVLRESLWFVERTVVPRLRKFL